MWIRKEITIIAEHLKAGRLIRRITVRQLVAMFKAANDLKGLKFTNTLTFQSSEKGKK